MGKRKTLKLNIGNKKSAGKRKVVDEEPMIKANNMEDIVRDEDDVIDDLEGLPDSITDDNIEEVEQLEDGSVVYEIDSGHKNMPDNGKFYANLAMKMSDDMLGKISSYVLDCLEEDMEAREPWLEAHNCVKKYLGYNSLKDFDKLPFDQACREVDSTLSTALIRFCAIARSEMLPESGPAGFKIYGESNEELEEIARVRSQWLNYYLTVKDSSYYKDFGKSLHYVGFYGTMIRKVYYDNSCNKPISRFVLPENFLINIDCTSILESDRLTHILKMTASEVLANQKNNVYRDVELPYLKVNADDSGNISNDNSDDTSSYNHKALYDVYESHIYLNLETFETDYASDEITEVAKPYIVTIDKESKEILSIKRSWKEDDETFTRVQYFVAYEYFPGFDIHGLGLARIAGSNAISVTNMLRQSIDAATFQNLPSGFVQQGSTKQQVRDIRISPGVWAEMNAIGGSIQDLFSPLPASGPSPALIELRQEVISQMQEQLSTTELGMMSSKEDIPTGTAIAFLEESNKIQSAVLKSLHTSFSEELRLLDNIFKECVEKEEFFINGESYIITKDHFIDSVQIIPVSDPSVNSNIQRMVRASSVFETAMQAPEQFDMSAVVKYVLQAQGLDSNLINSFLAKSEEEAVVNPEDPVTENMNMMMGKPVKAGIAQNHDAHIAVHAAVDNDQAKAHIQEHMALKFLVQMQNEMGVDLMSIDPNDIELQNVIAINAARAVESLGLTDHLDKDEELDPNKLYAADIAQKREANVIRKEIADKKLEGDIFKSQLDFEKEKIVLKADEKETLIKAWVDVQKLKEKGYDR